jgi:(S)-ureidoglycine-glyoxylate aminotransferase
VEVVESRKSIEAGIRDADSVVRADRIRSNYFDLGQILDYWGPKRLNHHTEATTMLYSARECARILLEEGIDASVARHRLHGEAMLAGVQGLGLVPFGDLAHRMTNVLGVEIPEGVAGDAVRAELLEDYGIEIGTSFGPLHGRVWRIGTMGYNARRDAVLGTLAALEAVLRRHGVRVAAGGGTEAALDSYAGAA